MKKKKSIKILLLLNIMLLSIAILFLIAAMSTKNNTQLSKTIQSSGEKMIDTSQITELEKQIDSLNSEHTTYGQYIQTSKVKIATAITNGGIETSVDATADIMETNIATLATNRYNAGVTAADNRANSNSINYQTGYNNGYNAGKTSSKSLTKIKLGGANTSYNLTGYSGWQNFNSNNFVVTMDYCAVNPRDDRGATAAHTAPSFSYNSSTGILTVSNYSYNRNGGENWDAGATCSTYLIYAQ